MRSRESHPVGDASLELYDFAEQLLDDPVRLATYDRFKWNLAGDPNSEYRHEGDMPWITRLDDRGYRRAYTLDVFSGVSLESDSMLVVRKDRWTDVEDPLTWLAVETSFSTGETRVHEVWSAYVDQARNLWLELAKSRAHNQPVWYEHGRRRQAFRDLPAHDQTRITARLDPDWRTSKAEFRAGLYNPQIHFEDIEALESMIIAVQQIRAAQGGEIVQLDSVEGTFSDDLLAA